jgi:peptide/nickel transport system permease protein
VSATLPPAELRRRPFGRPIDALFGGVRRDWLAATGAVLVLLIVLVAVFAPWLAPHDPNMQDLINTLTGPSRSHPFGTDLQGRDVLSRVIFGARTSLRIAVESLAIAALIGIPLGVVAGYVGGWIDDVIMRITDVFLAFPALLLALALESVVHPSVGNASIAIAVTWWPWYTRLIRAQASAVGSTGYVAAARALGVSGPRIVFRHVLPNSVAPVVVQISLDFGGVILTAAALSYLGLGAQDPTSEWGLMVSQGQTLFTTNWWVVTFPGLAILVTALAFNLLGDGLRTVLDPRQVRRDRDS